MYLRLGQLPQGEVMAPPESVRFDERARVRPLFTAEDQAKTAELRRQARGFSRGLLGELPAGAGPFLLGLVVGWVIG